MQQTQKRIGNYQLIVFGLVLFLIGCVPKVRLVGEYDSIMDSTVHRLEAKTAAHFKQISDFEGENAGSFEQNRLFYQEVSGEIHALQARAAVLEEGLKRTPLTNNFKELKAQYEDLEILHQTPYNMDAMMMAKNAFEQSFRAIVKHLMFMKWNQKQPK